MADSTLRQLINEGPVPALQVVDIGQHLARRLAEDHDRKIIHGGLTPESIVVAPDGDVQILEDPAREAPDPDDAATLHGSVYSAPEQVRGQDIDHRADLWSLGVILYELFSGSRPFAGPVPEAARRAILESPFEPVTRRHPGLDAELPEGHALHGGVDGIMDRCLAKDPNRRYQSAGDLLQDLELLTRGEARFGGHPEVFPLRRALTSLGLVLAAVILALIGSRLLD